MSSLTVPQPPASTVARLRWTCTDGTTVVIRNLNHLRRAPGQLVAELIFPVVMVLLFGYVFGSAIQVPGGNYREFLIPGLFAMTAVSSVAATGQIIAGDVQRGVMDRFRSMPMARSAVAFGQTGVDIITGAIGLFCMALCGLVVGWRIHTGLLPGLAGFGLLLLLRYALSWVGVYMGLAVKNEETADRLGMLFLPISMLANTFVPTGGMPGWLRFLSNWNPISAVVAACRQLFGHPGAPAANAALPLQHPVIATVAWSILILAIFVPLAVQKYYGANR
jgi:ABC-2 type transport system permease protein